MKLFVRVSIFLASLMPLFSVLASDLDSLKKVILSKTEDTLIVSAYASIAREVCFNQPDSAIWYSQKGLVLAKRLLYSKGQGQSYYNLGLANHVKGKMNDALSYYDSASLFFNKVNDLQGLAKVYNNSGVIYTVKGNYVKGLHYFQQSLEIKIKLKEINSLGNAYNNIGNIKYSQKAYQEAINYYEQSLTIQDSTDNYAGLARSLGNIGLVYNALEQYENAIKYYRQAFLIVEKYNIPNQNPYNADGLAEAYYEIKELDSAKWYAQLAYDEGKELNDPVVISSSLHSLGLVYMAEKKYTQGVEQLNQSLEVAKREGLLREEKNAADGLFQLHKKMKKYEDALRYHERFQMLSDSLFNEDLTRQLTESELNFAFSQERDSIDYAFSNERLLLQSEIKQKNLIQLSTYIGLALALLLLFIVYRFYQLRVKTNHELQTKNTIISEALEKNKVLIKEIHHRVKNNLQIVSSLLNIQSRFTKDEAAKQTLANMHSRVLAMSLVHENLYKTDHVTHVYTDEYLVDLANAIDSTLNVNGVVFRTDMERIKIPSDMAVKVGLMTNELLTNAYKHAFPKEFGGEKRLSLIVNYSENHLRIETCDNGVGISQEPNNKSYGLQLIRSLIKSLDGRLDIQTADNTLFTLFIPLK